MVAAALVYDTDGFEEECTRTSRRCKSWSPGQRIRLADELCINAPTSSDETTTCSSRLASKETITTDQDVTPPHSEATSVREEDNSLEGDDKEGADEYDIWGDTDLEGDDDYSSARCVVKKACWADQTDQALGPVIGLGGQVLGGDGALQQRAGTSEQRAWTESVCEAPAAAGPPMHARQHAAGWWAAGPIAGLPPRTSSRRGPSSGADAVASPVRAGSNRKADGSTPWSGKVTTVMVRNLPPTLKRQDFWRELDATGFCYIPRDFTSGRCQGHAFLNFKEAADASRFRVVWHNTERFGCRDPLVDVSPARIQGYEANAREANSSRGRNKVRNPHFRSLIKVQDADPPPPRGLQSAGSVPSGWAAADAEGPRKAWSKRQAQASRRASAEESATQQAGMALERGGSNQQRRP